MRIKPASLLMNAGRIAVIVLMASGCATRPAAPRPELSPAPHALPEGWRELSDSPHVALGVPVDADPSDDVLLDHHVFVLSYNPSSPWTKSPVAETGGAGPSAALLLG
jgi:hypothetical protein